MKNDDRFLELRKKAEALIDTNNSDSRKQFEDIDLLLTELNIHQIELEMQQQELEKANEEVNTEREKYLDLYLDAPVAYFTLNETGNILELNNAAAALLGAPIHRFRFNSIFPYLEEESRITFTLQFRDFFLSNQRGTFKLVFISETTSRVETQVQAKVYYDPQHAQKLMRCTVVDISALVNYESELQHQKALNNAIIRYQTLFAVTTVGIEITDPQGKILDVNDAFTEITGYAREELIGANMRLITHPDSAENENRTFESLSLEQPTARYEKRYRRKDGTERWGDLTVSMVFTGDSRDPDYAVGVLLDITENIRSRNEIQHLNNRLQAAMKVGNLAWWELDLPSGSIRFNEHKARILGYEPADFTHYEHFMALVHPDDYGTAMQAMKEHIYGKREIYDTEYRIRGSDGDYLWFRDTGKITETNGDKRTITGIVTNITDRKETEKLKDDISHITQHDLKNPLTGILGAVELFQKEHDSRFTEEQKEILRLIEQSGQRMLHMINRTLDLYKIEKGTYSVVKKEIQFGDMINSVLRELESHMRSVRVTAEVSLGQDNSDAQVIVEGEWMLCYSTFANLIRNAVEASDQGDTIRISSTRQQDGSTRISVWNSKAIPETIRETFGGKHSTYGKKEGTGLGVYSARLMIDAQDGSFDWTSSEEEGTTISVTLPGPR